MTRENKTKQTSVSPASFIKQIEGEQKRNDSNELVALMKRITGKPPKMWGPSIVGFGTYHYKYESGREGDMPLTGFSPRKPSLVLYLGPGMQDAKLLARLGKHKVSKGCMYINKLHDVDRDVLREIVEKSVAEMRKRYSS